MVKKTINYMIFIYGDILQSATWLT